jgi:hypothetical protein
VTLQKCLPSKRQIFRFSARIAQRLAFPNRLARFLFRLFSSNSDVFQVSIIHLHQLSALPVAFTAQSVNCSEATEDPEKRSYSCWSIYRMQVNISSSKGVGPIVQTVANSQLALSKQISLFLCLHCISTLSLV